MDFPVEIPEKYLEKARKLELFPEDIEERLVRGSGKGGQKINKTSSCVQLKHIPSGVSVNCQKHRMQSANRLSAYKSLILKIEEVKLGKESEKAKKIFKLRKQKKRRSKKAKEKMLADKKARSSLKATRKSVLLDEN